MKTGQKFLEFVTGNFSHDKNSTEGLTSASQQDSPLSSIVLNSCLQRTTCLRAYVYTIESHNRSDTVAQVNIHGEMVRTFGQIWRCSESHRGVVV